MIRSDDDAVPTGVRGQRRQALIAASWPAAAALFCAAFALWPQRFPAATGESLLLIAVAELPALFIGVAHAEALGERSRGMRYLVFGIGLVVLLLLGGFRLLLDVQAHLLLPVLGWLLVSVLVELWSGSDDPRLAREQAWAVLYDRASLLGLLPALLIGSLLLALGLHIGGLLLGLDFSAWLSEKLNSGHPELLALLGTLYLGVVAASSAHVHGAAFLAGRRRLLDRPWIEALTRSGGGGD